VSDPVKHRPRTGTQPPRARSERRAAAKAAKARAAAAQRRRQQVTGVLAGLGVVAVLVGTMVACGGSSDDPATTGSAAPPSAAAPSGAAGLPPGADPALGTRPTTTAGTGELSKLTVTPLIRGTGAPTAAGQEITVNYVGVSYRTGEEFDASWKRGEPFSFPLGQGRVIPGWDQGLVGVPVGSRVQLDIPADLAYGENPGAGQPGGPLRFVVDVLAAR
jgi:peptidylprolyl isomerase